MNILDSTETFMQKAKQLDANPKDNWNAKQHRLFRLALLLEEISEYLEAEKNDDLVEAVDGLLDIIVIAWGTLLSYVGPDKTKAAAQEVARSNLDKVIGEGLPLFREDGKVIKPEGWKPPNILESLGLSVSAE